MSSDAIEIEVSNNARAQVAVVKAKDLARKLGFSECDQTKTAIVTSELAHNILVHAGGKGRIFIDSITKNDRVGITIIAEDKGPGIVDIEKALQGAHTPKKGLGIGLCGANCLADEFEIRSKIGEGTTIIAKKWKTNHTFPKEANYCL